MKLLTALYPSTQKTPDDVVITLAIRTPLTKGFKGGLKDTGLDFIVYSLLKKVLERSNIDPQMIEDVCLGNVLLPPPSSLPQTPLTYTFTGQQGQGSLHLPRRLPRSRLPHYRRRLLRKPLLLLRPQSRPRYREPNKHR